MKDTQQDRLSVQAIAQEAWTQKVDHGDGKAVLHEYALQTSWPQPHALCPLISSSGKTALTWQVGIDNNAFNFRFCVLGQG